MAIDVFVTRVTGHSVFQGKEQKQQQQQQKPGGNAAEDGVEVVAAEWEEDGRRRGPELHSVMVALTVRVDEMTNLWQQLFDQHGLIQT